MNWLLTSLMVICGSSVANALAKSFSRKIAPMYALMLFAIGALFASLTGFIILRLVTTKGDVFTKEGALLAILAGIIWGISQLFLFITLSKSVPIAIVLPLIVGGIAIGGVIAGIAVFKESLTTIQILGIVLVLVGSAVLAK